VGESRAAYRGWASGAGIACCCIGVVQAGVALLGLGSDDPNIDRTLGVALFVVGLALLAIGLFVVVSICLPARAITGRLALAGTVACGVDVALIVFGSGTGETAPRSGRCSLRAAHGCSPVRRARRGPSSY
jgi:hypothetical protein